MTHSQLRGLTIDTVGVICKYQHPTRPQGPVGFVVYTI